MKRKLVALVTFNVLGMALGGCGLLGWESESRKAERESGRLDAWRSCGEEQKWQNAGLVFVPFGFIASSERMNECIEAKMRAGR
jgi:hypothetical protein